ncbi:MAG: zinc protease [Myxococcales bacterium]|nr:zinc protease [Myxococcales bacterium]
MRSLLRGRRLLSAATGATVAMGAMLSLALVACGGNDAPPPVAPQPPPIASAAPPPGPVDPLGPRPPLPPPPPFVPPVPVAYTRPNGMTVWILERHALPIVSMQVVVPAGAATDPADKGGLALATANMLDEGAGTRGALDISRDIDRLGATLSTGAYADYAFAAITTLKKNLAPASAILGDVITKPTFSPVEWKRVHDLWLNELRARQSEPDAVAGVVSLRQLFGSDPYGHPTNGTLKSAARVTLEDAKKFYATSWRPDHATVVVAGDVTRAELDPLLDQVFGAWKAPKAEPTTLTVGKNDATKPGRRVVVVDRADAPQSVLALVRPGVAASDPDAPALVRINTALGGSFTSRLNQDLREEHGWSYGARSRFSFNKRKGLFSAQAAVHTEHTGEALQAMIADVEAIAREGLTDEEVEKTRLIARGELVDAFESVEAAARRLARNAGVGLPADHEAKAALALDRATKDDLRRLAAGHVDPKDAIIVIVGPRAKLQPQLEKLGITAVETSGPEGD